MKQACVGKGGHESASNSKVVSVVRDSGNLKVSVLGEAVFEVVLQHPT